MRLDKTINSKLLFLGLSFARVMATIVLATLIDVTSSHANIIGNDTANFNPNPSGLDFVTVHGSETLALGVMNSGLFFNRAKNTLPTAILSNGTMIDPDDWVNFVDFGIAYGLTPSFEVGLSISSLTDQETKSKSTGAQFAATGLNDIRIISKYNWLERSPLGLASVFAINFNQTRNNPFTGRDSGPTFNFELIADGHWRSLHTAINVGYRGRSQGAAIANSIYHPLPDQIVASAAISYYITALDLKILAEAIMARATTEVPQIKDSRVSNEYLIGAKYDWSRGISSHIGGGTRFTAGLFAPEWRAYVGLNFALDILRAPATTIQSNEPALAAAPQVVNKYTGYLPTDIEKLRTADFDETAKHHEFNLRTTVPAADIGGQKPPFEVLRLDGFDFEFASAEIKKENHVLLNRLSAYLNAPPTVLKVRIEGHTDSIGNNDRKKALSRRRAEAVVKYLKGLNTLSKVEFEAVGFGADRPIADNGNFQGRKQNRRVEVRILRQLEKPPERVSD